MSCLCSKRNGKFELFTIQCRKKFPAHSNSDKMQPKHQVQTLMSAFLPLQDLENLPHLEDPCFVPYQGHNAFREKYFSGLNKKGGKQEDDKTNASAETLI